MRVIWINYCSFIPGQIYIRPSNPLHQTLYTNYNTSMHERREDCVHITAQLIKRSETCEKNFFFLILKCFVQFFNFHLTLATMAVLVYKTSYGTCPLRNHSDLQINSSPLLKHYRVITNNNLTETSIFPSSV